jgi:Zn-dependent peptidase ImmA (M78 family)/DNA-binding XRE family transcriptional regulator
VLKLEIAKIIGDNLHKVQKEYDYSQEDLGKIIGVTRQTIAKYINGERIMDSGKLYKIANHFNKPIDFFLSQNNNETMSFMFRADDPQNNFNKNLKRHISKRFNLFHEIIELSDLQIKDYIPEEYNLITDNNKLSKEDKNIISKIAEKQRRSMGVDDALNFNIFSLFEENNINIIAEDIDDQNLDALSAYSNDMGAYIYINDSKKIPEERKIFSVVHEFGHLLFHRDEYNKEMSKLKYTNSKIKDIREKVADYFAMSFLVPSKALNSYSYYFDGYIDLDLIIEKKQEFGVSAKCLIMALKENNFISNSTLGALYNQLNKNGYKTLEPNPREYIKKNEKLYALIRTMLIKEKITINKAANALNIPIIEMRKLAKRWKNI